MALKSDSTYSTFSSFLFSLEKKVRWVQQQHEKIRKKRDYQKVRFPGAGSSRNADPLSVLRSIASQSQIQYRNTDSHLVFPDPLFKEQWYMVSHILSHGIHFAVALSLFIQFDSAQKGNKRTSLRSRITMCSLALLRPHELIRGKKKATKPAMKSLSFLCFREAIIYITIQNSVYHNHGIMCPTSFFSSPFHIHSTLLLLLKWPCGSGRKNERSN